ncbi:hypothetical protein [Owenweeksia hongkongensis]|uniref:hypothetical protein n=1 Tax=Owenweeksia hongkongensis TaxID=253245 RepID=UPI000303CEAB|nr:hypothetical protein [Owenweeksia hongkongensis]
MRIHFFIPDNPNPLNFRYYHAIVVLAEGLKKEKIEYFGNTDYWYDPINQEYLITKAPEKYRADVNIYLGKCFEEAKIRIDKSRVNILLDTSDGMFTCSSEKRFMQFDLIFKAHYNSNYNYSEKVKPWPFALSNRIIDTIDETRVSKQEDKVLVNFRGGHTLRKLVIANFHPLLADKYLIDDSTEVKLKTSDFERIENVKDIHKSYLYQTAQRHNPKYFERLNGALFTSVFGGFVMLKPIRKYKMRPPFRQLFKHQVLLSGIKINSKNYFMYQYDSWRFWESLYADTVPIHLDFEEWGAVLPVMPVNGVHYIGVKNFDFEACAEYIKSLSHEQIKQIAENGKKWVIENYTPAKVTQYVVEEINKMKKLK